VTVYASGRTQSEQMRRVTAIMHQAETVADLHLFATAPQTQAIAHRLGEGEREELAETYDVLRLRLRGRIKFDALAGRRVLVTAAGRPYYSDKQGADVVDFSGWLSDDGRPFQTTSAAPNVVRFFRRLAMIPSTERPLNVRFQRVATGGDRWLWRVRAIPVHSVEVAEGNPFRDDGEEG
jgi:hypothetical protein